MIRLFNHTKCPDGPIKDFLAFAARVIGVKGQVCVKVNRARCPRLLAHARKDFPYEGYMRGTSDRKGRNGRLLGDLPGYIILVLPDGDGSSGWQEVCEWFGHCCLHEMAHIRQCREGRYSKLREEEARRSPGRRMAYALRPVEIDAENQVYDAMEKDRRRKRRWQKLVAALATAVEEPDEARMLEWFSQLFEDALRQSNGDEAPAQIGSGVEADEEVLEG
jgi:hypothetical protein